LPLFVFVTLLPGCAGGSDPLTPDITDQIEQPEPKTDAAADEGNYYVLGAYEMLFDPVTESLQIVRSRELLEHYINVTHFLFPPECEDCVDVEIDFWDSETGELLVHGTMKNPMNFDVYVPRVVFLFPDIDYNIDLCLGYTDRYHDGDGPERDPFVYARYGSEFDPVEPDQEISRYYHFRLSGPFEKIPPIKFLIEAHWPGPYRPPFSLRMEADDEQKTTIFPNGQGTLLLQLRTSWENPPPVIDLAELGTGEVDFAKDEFEDDKWVLEMTGLTPSPGDYVCWARVESPESSDVIYWPFEIRVPSENNIAVPYVETIYDSTVTWGSHIGQQWGNYGYLENAQSYSSKWIPADFSDPLNPVVLRSPWPLHGALTTGGTNLLQVGDGVAAMYFPNPPAPDEPYMAVFDLESDPIPDPLEPAARIYGEYYPWAAQGKEIVTVRRVVNDYYIVFIDASDPYNPILSDVVGPTTPDYLRLWFNDKYVISPHPSEQAMALYKRGSGVPSEIEAVLPYENGMGYLFVGEGDVVWSSRIDPDECPSCKEWLGWKRNESGEWEEISPPEFPENLYPRAGGFELDGLLYCSTFDTTISYWGFSGWDFSDPLNPQFIEYHPPTETGIKGVGRGIRVFGDYLVTTSANLYQPWLSIFHKDDWTTPVKEFPNPFPTASMSIDVAEPICLLGQLTGGIKLLDIYDHENPLLMSKLDLNGIVTDVRIGADSDYAYAALFDDPEFGEDVGYKVVDISDPYNPSVIAYVPYSGAIQVALVGDILVGGADKLGFWDISDPANPAFLGELTHSGGTDGPIRAMESYGSKVYYRTDYTRGLCDLTSGWPPPELEEITTLNLSLGGLDVSGDYFTEDIEDTIALKGTVVGSIENWLSNQLLVADFDTSPSSSSVLGNWAFVRTDDSAYQHPQGWRKLEGYNLLGNRLEPDWTILVPSMNYYNSYIFPPSGGEMMSKDGYLYMAGAHYDLVIVRMW
jgi:hypothetical protein